MSKDHLCFWSRFSKLKNQTKKWPLKIQKPKKASNHKMSENRPSPNMPTDSKTTFEIFKTRSSGRYAAVLLAPAEGWWTTALLTVKLFDFGSLWILSHFWCWVTFDLESCFGIRMDIFWGVSFLTFCDLKLFIGFWILRGHFWVWFLSFENRDQKHKWSLDNFEVPQNKNLNPDAPCGSKSFFFNLRGHFWVWFLSLEFFCQKQN